MAVVDPESFEPWRQYSLQHRVARGAGGTKDPAANAAVNLILLDGDGVSGCHGRAEHDIPWATENGYRVASWEDPAQVAVVHFQYGRTLLSESGWLR
jgi:hypothetical protein